MDVIINSISLLLLFLVGIVAYALVMKNVLPRLLLKGRYRVEDKLGRGLKKYVFPSGRGVVYEPHPSIRKYIKRYALIVNDGYKYIKCQIDRQVKSFSYTVIMLNNKNKVIDVLDVNEHAGDDTESQAVLIHHETSYVGIILRSVNGIDMECSEYAYHTLLDVCLYTLAAAVLTLLEFWLATWTLSSSLYGLFALELSIAASAGAYILPSMTIGASCAIMLLLRDLKKGVRVVINGK